MILNPGGRLGGSGLGDMENVPRGQGPQARKPGRTFRAANGVQKNQAVSAGGKTKVRGWYMSPVTAFSGQVALDLFPYGCWAREAVINTDLIDRMSASPVTRVCDEEGTGESGMTKAESRGEARGW